MRRYLPHERLLVYQKAACLYAECTALTNGVPRRHWSLVEQLLRAVASIALNIAEGCTEYSRGDKARFYRIARRSAGESAAAIDLLRSVEAIEPSAAARIKGELQQIIAILVTLTRKLSGDN